MKSDYSIWTELKHQYRYGDIVIKIILLNIGIYALQLLLSIPFWATNQLAYVKLGLHYFYMPSQWTSFLTRPWTLISYMFLHDGFIHLLFNMVIFYWFGRIFLLFQDKKKILPLYLLGGISGALFFLLSVNVLPVFRNILEVNYYLVGASAGVLSIVIATATLVPDYEVRLFLIGQLKLKYVVLFILGYYLMQLLNHQNAGGHIAHFGGALFGYMYIRLLQKGTDIAKPFNKGIERFLQFRDDIYNRFKNGARLTTLRGGKRKNPFKKTHKKQVSKQERVDAILDKIARSGYDSLSEKEKQFLFSVSNKK